MHKVFVYGTLKKGFSNHHLLSSSKYLGTSVTLPKYEMVSLGGYPGVIDGGELSIHGEVYEVSDEVLERLDRLEGYPSYYGKTEVDTDYGNATMYTLPDKYLKYSKVPNGNWL